ncbi:hypothetical protein B0H19DRAFT_1060519 [Mycena capillaripes]|nr:hypothetical protein B0H19DRAFT_1060519 [Mycena capillaripes]
MDPMERPGYIDSFQTAPSLVDVGVFNLYRFIPTAFPIHLSVINSMARGRSTWRFKPSLKLVEARIEIDFTEHSWLDSAQFVDLKRLRRLYVSDLEVLNYLRVPALEEIGLQFRHDSGRDVAPFHALLERSSCRLRRAFLKDPTTRAVAEILPKSSSITELIILNDDPDGSKVVNGLMASLTVSNIAESTVVTPHLSLMFFACEDENSIYYTLYLEMVKSRWQADHCALKTAALLTVLGPGPDPAAANPREARPFSSARIKSLVARKRGGA